MKENFIGKYSQQKTLRFSLIPQGKTEEHFEHDILKRDQNLALAYVDAKKIIDRYHINFIEESLNKCVLDTSDLEKYHELYLIKKKSEKENDAMRDIESKLRKAIFKSFSDNPKYADLFKANLIKKDIYEFLDETEKATIENFAQFTTYFTGFNENRKNMYSTDDKSTAISYRVVNQNLPKFIDNMKSFEDVLKKLDTDTLGKLKGEIKPIYAVDIKDMFTLDFFTNVVSQSGIDNYNQVIGGFTKDDGTKIQGLNEYINLHNQKNKDKSNIIPKLKMLFKQILSDRETVSFIPEKFENDQAVFCGINEFYNNADDGITYRNCIAEMGNLLSSIDTYNLELIYVKNDKKLSDLSNLLFNNWNTINQGLVAKYDNENMKKPPKNIETYMEKRSKAIKNIDSISLAEIKEVVENIIDEDVDFLKSFSEEIARLNNGIEEAYADLEELLKNEYTDKRLIKDDRTIQKIKKFLDLIKEYQRFVGLFSGSGKEADKDYSFYGEYDTFYEKLNTVNILYDKVRNYVTQKPYSKDKIKLTFDCPTLLGGWDKNKEESNLSIIFKKDDKYYLGIMAKKHNKVFRNAEIEQNNKSDDYYDKMTYKLLPGPNKMLPKVFLSKKGIETFNPSKEIIENYKNDTHKKGDKFNLKHCQNLIDFFKDSIEKHEDWSKFNFKFSNTKNYRDLSDFYNEVSSQGYKITFEKIDSSYINQLVDDGKLYLFQIYNKDFSEYSKGTPNLHTMYFKALFNDENLKDVVYKLNGEGEIFYRKASIKENERIIHYKGEVGENKNPLNPKKIIFEHDIIKDKRYTKSQFLFHFPITLNFKAGDARSINDEVRSILKQNDKHYVIGIDRGERHLLYVTVINEKSEIVEQYSLNEIVNNINGINIRTDYHDLLQDKEKERLKSRLNWKSIESIKELKEGYISQVVHKICQLVDKYDAVIVMEDLNSGFKNSRIKVEKQVYQKFEKMLIDKLNYYVDKSKDATEDGGVLRAYQLTNKFISFEKLGKQSGIIFYIPAWLTSKIDPTTGFVDLLKPKYTSIDATKEFIDKFDSIKYNDNEDYFEFKFDYSNFPKGNIDYKREWTVCTFNDRIRTFRNAEKNNEWDNEEIILTKEFKTLFEEYDIKYDVGDLKEAICKQNESKFFKSLIHLMKLTLQMRNSVTREPLDYLISPVKNDCGVFYDSRSINQKLPENADANGAYNIAKKGLWAIEQIKKCDDVKKVNLAISNKEWLEYTQKN